MHIGLMLSMNSSAILAGMGESVVTKIIIRVIYKHGRNDMGSILSQQ